MAIPNDLLQGTDTGLASISMYPIKDAEMPACQWTPAAHPKGATLYEGIILLGCFSRV